MKYLPIFFCLILYGQRFPWNVIVVVIKNRYLIKYKSCLPCNPVFSCADITYVLIYLLNNYYFDSSNILKAAYVALMTGGVARTPLAVFMIKIRRRW